MKRIAERWQKIASRMSHRSSGQLEALRLMFFAGAAAAGEIMIEAERSPNGVKIIEDFGRELMEAQNG